jgi:hypothetical protein
MGREPRGVQTDQTNRPPTVALHRPLRDHDLWKGLEPVLLLGNLARKEVRLDAGLDAAQLHVVAKEHTNAMGPVIDGKKQRLGIPKPKVKKK